MFAAVRSMKKHEFVCNIVNDSCINATDLPSIEGACNYKSYPQFIITMEPWKSHVNEPLALELLFAIIWRKQQQQQHHPKILLSHLKVSQNS